jgi:hypothetical protein
MARAKRSIQGTTNIDGFKMVWTLHREQQWFTADGWKGVSIHVKLAEGRARRELFLEFPPVGTERPGNTKDAPAQVLVSAAKVEAGIRDAMAGGWDPESRGQPHFFQTDLLPG